MPLSYQQITQPTVEPVSLILAKQHLRVDFTDDDSYIAALITAARQRVEKMMNRAIFNRKMLLTLDYFPWPGWGSTTGTTAHDYFLEWFYRGLCIRLPFPACMSVDKISYVAADGVTVIEIDSSRYILDAVSEPARISPAPGYTWPYQQTYIPGQVKVNFTAGTYELAVAENFTVPEATPYTYTLQQASLLVTFNGVTNAQSEAVNCTNTAGTLTFTAAQAAQQLTANYTVNNCPQTIIWAILLLIANWYDNRHAASTDNLKVTPLGVAELLAGEKCESFEWES